MCDLILFNANVITMDPVLPKAQLVEIKERQIVSVSGNEMLERVKKPGTRIIDCMGRTLLPGFVDAHCHVTAYAENLVSLNLSPQENIRCISDIQRKIRDFCKDHPPGAWVRGKGYNEFHIAEKRHPTRWDLDSAAPLNPVKLTHRSGHAHVLNSMALDQAGISAETGDPPEGLIDRDPETGAPTGILYGMSAYLAGKVPPLGDAELERGLKLANEKLLSYGITSVQDASSGNDLRQWSRFEAAKARGILQPRLTMMTGWNGFVESRPESFSSGTGLRLGGVKITAGLTTGSLHPGQVELNEQVSAINEAGRQAVIHAIEEPVIEAACKSIVYALDRHFRPNHRHRIEHCSVCSPSLRRRLARLGITVVTQPSFIYYSGERYLETVSPDQFEHLYPIGSLLNSGVPIGAGSDFPISDPNPLVSVCAAVTRKTEKGDRVLPLEGISILEALAMHTLGAAAAGFEEKTKGSVSPGKVADLILLSENPLAVDADQIKDIRVVMTVLGGKIAWERPAP